MTPIMTTSLKVVCYNLENILAGLNILTSSCCRIFRTFPCKLIDAFRRGTPYTAKTQNQYF